jgi:hypothetical protein
MTANASASASATAHQAALAGVLSALGIALPVLFHMVGLGRVFLPMHLPVLVAGLVLRPRIAWTVGMVVPLLSSFLTGMPPMPLAILMAVELVILAETASACAFCGLPALLSALLAVAARCAVSWLATSTLASHLGLPSSASGWVYIAVGLPGIALQLVIAPVVALSILKRPRPAITEQDWESLAPDERSQP